MNINLGVIGQGYVGLPLSLAAAKNGFHVIGIDSDVNKINKLNSGRSSSEDVLDELVSEQVKLGRYTATNSYDYIAFVEIIIICVPTPLDSKSKPDLSILEQAVISFAKFLKKGSLVILESTVEPGTTRDFLIPLLESKSGLSRNEFDVAFSPERTDPGNKKWNLTNTPKIVAGFTVKSRKRAVDFYSKFVSTVVECESLEVAEIAKLLENSFRLINISFINEISIFCDKIGIDVKSVIRAASTKPYGFLPFYPSIGVGGHCIPVDPIYLSYKAREIGAPIKIIELAAQINQGVPEYFVEVAEKMLGDLKSKKILVIGVAYKPNVSDVRETPSEALITGLKRRGARIDWHDELVGEWNGSKSVPLSADYDLAILATPHDYLDLTMLGNVPILNTYGSI